MFSFETHIQLGASGRPLGSDPCGALSHVLLSEKRHQEIRSHAHYRIKTDAANTPKAITGVITSLYPGAIICAEPDIRLEIL